jgi:membrane-bound lytic murein transglycosylase B
MKKFHKELNQTEHALGVEKEIITAILLVETQLGSYLGNKSIINTLSTLAALSDEDFRETFWEKMSSPEKYEKQEYEKKAREKSTWAFKELKAYLSYCEKEGLNPTEIKGSFSGAMGIAQFMPSNILKLAVDGNNDGHIDLFNNADAIMSIANFLNYHKWHKGMKHENAYRVLLSYNYSKPYAETLLKIADRLKK